MFRPSTMRETFPLNDGRLRRRSGSAASKPTTRLSGGRSMRSDPTLTGAIAGVVLVHDHRATATEWVKEGKSGSAGSPQSPIDRSQRVSARDARIAQHIRV